MRISSPRNSQSEIRIPQGFGPTHLDLPDPPDPQSEDSIKRHQMTSSR